MELIVLWLVCALVFSVLLGWAEFRLCRAVRNRVIPWGLLPPLVCVCLSLYWVGALFGAWPFLGERPGSFFYELVVFFWGAPVGIISLGVWIGGVTWLARRKKYPTEED